MKELVDHIRTVHFTVFVVALVLTIAIREHRKPQLDRAADDADAILLLNQKWHTVENNLMTALASNRQGGISSTTNAAHVQQLTPGRYILKGRSVYPTRPVTFDVTREWIYVDEVETDENPGWGESQEFIERLPAAWKNLREFLALWDGFHTRHRAFVTMQVATERAENRCNDVERVPDSSRTDYPSAFLVSRPKFKDNWILNFSLEAMEENLNKHKHACDFAPVEVFEWQGDLGGIFAGIAPQASKWGSGLSADEFRDLIAETKYLDDLPVRQLASALRQRADTDTDTIELFQAKIPVEAIATYGALVLIVCQMYLLAHLIELRRVGQDVTRLDWPTGYIGLYENRWVFGFTFLSMVLWPPVPLILFVQGAVTRELSVYFSYSALVVSVALGVGCALVLAFVRNSNPVKKVVDVK